MTTRYMKDMCTAAELGYTDTLLELRECGADWEERNDHGMTPLMLAILRERIWNIKLLLDAGAKINARTPNGRTPLMLAAATGYTEGLQFLIAAGAGLDARDHAGYTALTHAVSRNQGGSLRILLDAGADPMVADNEGYTPYGRAERWNRKPMVALLHQHGADTPRATPGTDSTPADATADPARLHTLEAWQRMSALETDTEHLPAALRGERDASLPPLVIRYSAALRRNIHRFIIAWMDRAFEESPDGYFTVFGRPGIQRMMNDALAHFAALGITLAGDALSGLEYECEETIVEHEHRILD